MKKHITFWISALIGVFISVCLLPSCSKDDDENENRIEGTEETGGSEESGQSNAYLVGYYAHDAFRSMIQRDASDMVGLGMSNWGDITSLQSTGIHIVDGSTFCWVVQGVSLSRPGSSIVYATDSYGGKTLYYYLETGAWRSGTYTVSGSTLTATIDGRNYAYSISGNSLKLGSDTFSKVK